MTPEEQQKKTELEQQINAEFSLLQQKLGDLKKDVQSETDETKKQEKGKKIQEMESELSEIGVGKGRLERMTSLQEQELLSLKTRMESLKSAIQNFRGEVADLASEIQGSVEALQEKIVTPTTYELLKDSNTTQRLLTIISSNQKEFKNLSGDTAEKKLEYIFEKIRNSIVLFMKNKLGDSETTEKVITNTIAPAFEWSLMEMLRDQGNEANISMLKRIDNISWNSFNKLLKGVGNFAKKASGSYSKFSQWMNAVDYLSVHNGVLRNPNKSQVLSNPLEFQKYMNDIRFAAGNFSPYTAISDNIFKIDDNQSFEFGISSQEKQSVLAEIGDIQVVNNPKTTALIVKMLDKPEKFLGATSDLQKTANGLLDGLNSVNSVTKMFGVDILGEITKAPEKRSFLFKIMDFVCKLIGITGGLEGIVKKRRLDRMDLTDKKNENISQIFEKYKELAGSNVSLSITDENSCKTALTNFVVTDSNTPSTKGDFLRDSIAENMDVSQVSSAVVQQVFGNSYLKQKEVDGKLQDELVVDADKVKDISYDQKLSLAHKHLQNMKLYLENYKDNDLSEFYTNIHSTEDLALCITASLYANQDDVIEGVKAKVFLPENYGSVRMSGEIKDNTEQASGEVSPYKLAEGEYPFKDVPPYKGISTYDLRELKMTPVLDYSELTKKHEGVVTLSGSNIKDGAEYPSNKTLGNRSNNPCNISHSSGDIGYLSATSAADGQALAKYDTPVNGIASAMRLLKNKYSNKSITEIDVGGYQGKYKPDEEIGLSALRIKWITNQCKVLGVGPHQMLNFEDPTTLKAFVAQIAVQETSTHIGKDLLDQAYEKAFS